MNDHVKSITFDNLIEDHSDHQYYELMLNSQIEKKRALQEIKPILYWSISYASLNKKLWKHHVFGARQKKKRLPKIFVIS